MACRLQSIHISEVKDMSLRTKIIVLAFGALAAIAGLGLDLTTLKNSLSVVASAGHDRALLDKTSGWAERLSKGKP